MRGVVFLLVLLAGCSAVLPTPTATRAPTPALYTLHQRALVPGWAIIITDAFLTRLPSGQDALIVDLTLQNTSASAASAPIDHFTLLADGQAEQRTSLPSRWADFPPRFTAGQQTDGHLAWSVPIDAHAFTLYYADLAIWQLQPS